MASSNSNANANANADANGATPAATDAGADTPAAGAAAAATAAATPAVDGPPLTIVHGACTVDADGCVTSPNFPASYESEQTCDIDVDRDGFVTASTFDTVAGHGSMSVDCHEFSGEHGPHDTVMKTGSTLMWTSDDSDEEPGWKICASDADAWDIATKTGPCTIPTAQPECWQSPNFPLHYGTEENCEIKLAKDTVVSSPAFHTEHDRDFIEVTPGALDETGHCTDRYSGKTGPNNFAVKKDANVLWHADDEHVDIANAGWKLCWSEEAIATRRRRRKSSGRRRGSTRRRRSLL